MTADRPRTRRPRRRVDGVLLLDKPTGLSSNAALQRAKRSLNAEKAGHTGTLDPLASGLLPLCFGEATKFAQFLLEATKRYTATVHFGVTTATGDAEGDVLGQDADVGALAARDIEDGVRRLPRQQRQLMNLDLPWRALDRDALARVLVIIAPLEFERGMGGGCLGQAAGEGG